MHFIFLFIVLSVFYLFRNLINRMHISLNMPFSLMIMRFDILIKVFIVFLYLIETYFVRARQFYIFFNYITEIIRCALNELFQN